MCVHSMRYWLTASKSCQLFTWSWFQGPALYTHRAIPMRMLEVQLPFQISPGQSQQWVKNKEVSSRTSTKLHIYTFLTLTHQFNWHSLNSNRERSHAAQFSRGEGRQVRIEWVCDSIRGLSWGMQSTRAGVRIRGESKVRSVSLGKMKTNFKIFTNILRNVSSKPPPGTFLNLATWLVVPIWVFTENQAPTQLIHFASKLWTNANHYHYCL